MPAVFGVEMFITPVRPLFLLVLCYIARCVDGRSGVEPLCPVLSNGQLAPMSTPRRQSFVGQIALRVASSKILS